MLSICWFALGIISLLILEFIIKTVNNIREAYSDINDLKFKMHQVWDWYIGNKYTVDRLKGLDFDKLINKK